MIRLAIVRILETYFRNPIAYLVLPALLTIYGAYSTFTTFEDGYVSGITIQIRQNELVQDLSLATNRLENRFDTPSELMANEVWNLLDTDLFMTELIETVDYSKPEHYTSHQTREEIEDSIFEGLQTIALSDNQIVIVMTYNNADIAFALVENIYDLYVNRKINDAIIDTASASDTIDMLVASTEQQKFAVEQELQAYLEAHPEPADSRLARRDVEQFQIDRLQQALERTTGQYYNALGLKDETDLAEITLDSSIRQSYIVIDGPISPIELTSTTDMIISIALFGIVGSVLSFGVMFLVAFFNQRIMVPLDAKNSSQLPIIGVIEFDKEKEIHNIFQQLLPVFAKRSRKKGRLKKSSQTQAQIQSLESDLSGSTNLT